MKPKIFLIRKYISMFLLVASMFFVATNVYARNKAVSGFVKDENALPIPGVNVVEKGTTQGARSIVKMKNFDHRKLLSNKTFNQYEERLH